MEPSPCRSFNQQSSSKGRERATFGFDISIHSATKYLNGHSDLVAGAVIASREWIDRIKHLLNHLGGCLDPHACFLLHRGLKTLALRVRQQNDNALAIATFLQAHPAIERCVYPGLENHPQHLLAKELLNGFGGMVAFEVRGGNTAAEQVLNTVSLPVHGPSLGGVETLMTRPSTTSHSGLSAGERAEMGISDSLIRLSVGIEAADDLIADLGQALGA